MLSSVLHSFKRIASGGLLLFAASLSPCAVAQTSPESLLIGTGDQLHIQVMDTPQMEQHPRVTDAGEVPIEGAGNVKVAGLTPAGAAIAIQNSLIDEAARGRGDD
jgi:polysaccharide export outer membrane protein